MKHMFMLAFFWLLVSALPSFAADTGECLTIDLGGGINLEMVKIPAGKFLITLFDIRRHNEMHSRNKIGTQNFGGKK